MEDNTSKINFNPWVGKNYEQGINGKKSFGFRRKPLLRSCGKQTLHRPYLQSGKCKKMFRFHHRNDE